MSRLVFRVGRLERQAQMGDEWGNHTEAWADLVQRYGAVHGQNMPEAEIVEAAMRLGPPPALTTLATAYRKVTSS